MDQIYVVIGISGEYDSYSEDLLYFCNTEDEARRLVALAKSQINDKRIQPPKNEYTHYAVKADGTPSTSLGDPGRTTHDYPNRNEIEARNSAAREAYFAARKEAGFVDVLGYREDFKYEAVTRWGQPTAAS